MLNELYSVQFVRAAGGHLVVI